MCGKLRAGMGYSTSAAPISLRRAFSVSCFDLNSCIAATVRGFATLATSTVLLETERFAKVAGRPFMSAIN
jgi:hypothetical protein